MAATAAKGCYQNPSEKLFTDKKAKDMGTNGVSQELHLKMSKKIAQLTKVCVDICVEILHVVSCFKPI